MSSESDGANPPENPQEMGRLLVQHGIEIQPPPAPHSYEATPASIFSKRAVRYTVAIGSQQITRETACERLSTELAAYIGQGGATLVGIDGINGFCAGRTEWELRSFCHSFDDDTIVPFADTHLPPGPQGRFPRHRLGGGS